MAATTNGDTVTYTILEADGQHADSLVEDRIFNEDPTHAYKVRFVRGALAPYNTAERKPWSDIPKEIRDEVQGIMVLKLYFTAEDLKLFPKLKV